jgi:hypothetical protein
VNTLHKGDDDDDDDNTVCLLKESDSAVISRGYPVYTQEHTSRLGLFSDQRTSRKQFSFAPI